MAIIRPVRLDTRDAQLTAYVAQGLDARAKKVFDAQLQQEYRIADLRDELQPAALQKALQESAAAAADVVKAMDAETAVERRRVEDVIDAEQRASAGAHLKTAEAINVERLKESENTGELRTILDAAKRAGGHVYAEAVAILKPRLQKMAAHETGLRRSMSGPSQMTSGAFALLCELSQPGVRSDRQRRDAVAARHAERRRQVLAAAAVVHPDLPRLIQQVLVKGAIAAAQG